MHVFLCQVLSLFGPRTPIGINSQFFITFTFAIDSIHGCSHSLSTIFFTFSQSVVMFGNLLLCKSFNSFLMKSVVTVGELVSTRLPDEIIIKLGCCIVLRRNLNIAEGWVNGTLCEVLTVTPNCILVCKLGQPNDKYPIPKTRQRIDIKGASYSILRSQFPVQLSYAVTVHRVQGLTVDKAIVVLNNNFLHQGRLM